MFNPLDPLGIGRAYVALTVLSLLALAALASPIKPSSPFGPPQRVVNLRPPARR